MACRPVTAAERAELVVLLQAMGLPIEPAEELRGDGTEAGAGSSLRWRRAGLDHAIKGYARTGRSGVEKEQ